jgi:hypothetical protein
VLYHYGMLLGVDDFETEQGFHVGKMRLHNAWLHGAGVVWGFDVVIDEEHAEIRVLPGLALDGAGRELRLDAPACVSIPAWAKENLVDEGEELPAEQTLKLRVEARHHACQTRAVPALATPCEGGGSDTACSRSVETIALTLVEKTAARATPGNRWVRILLGLRAPDAASADDKHAAKLREKVLAADPDKRAAAALDAFHELAALDATALRPAAHGLDEPASNSPAAEDEPIVLANITELTLSRTADGWAVSGGKLDLAVRPAHVPTSTIQELTLAALLCCGADDDGGGGAAPPAGDPGAILEFTSVDDKKLTLKASADLEPRTVRREAFSVNALGVKDWEEVGIAKATYRKTTKTIVLELNDAPALPWRLVAACAGPTPLLAADLSPLCGGTDFVHMEAN